MNAMLVGADRLGNIPDVLEEFGIHITAHVTGRDRAHQRRASDLPSGVGLVILFTDFIGHNVMLRFREAASRAGVELVCCRRSVCALKQALDRREASRCSECAAPACKRRAGRQA